MAIEIDSNPFPLGVLRPTPGTPLSILANYPALETELGTCNLILVQACATNAGKCYFGNRRLNKATLEGVFFTFIWPGDTFVLSNFVQNVYKLSNFKVDVDTAGDGLLVSIYIR